MTPSETAPVFIVGAGRSGSSVFHRMMCRHPNAAWMSTLLEKHPGRPARNRLLMHALDVPVIGAWLSHYAEPAECYAFWDRVSPGFSSPCRDLVAQDMSDDARERVRDALGSFLTARRSQLVVKITGWSRIGFLREVFPNAKFIHMLRDGRPVAASLLKMDWWRGWRGPSGWRWGELSAEYDAEWRQHARSFVALAGIQWKILMDAMDDAKRVAPADALLEVRYEDLCRDPIRHFRCAVEFAGLTWDSTCERAVHALELRSENEKWRRDLTPDQQAILETVLHSHLSRYGYGHVVASG